MAGLSERRRHRLIVHPRLALGRQLLNDFYLNKPDDIDMELIPVASGQIELSRISIIEDEHPETFHPTVNWERIRDQIVMCYSMSARGCCWYPPINPWSGQVRRCWTWGIGPTLGLPTKPTTLCRRIPYLPG